MTDQRTCFMPINAATGEDLRLAMQTLWLSGTVLPVGARLMVRHEFKSDETKPLEVIYAFALPRDSALRRFEVIGEGFTAHSELKRVEEAVKQYEEGIEAGHLSTLARQYRDGVVNLTLGNIRSGEKVTVAMEILAGVEARDDGFRFRFPFTLAPTYHAQARTIARAPGVGEMELPEEQFGDVLLPPFMTDASSLHRIGLDLTVQLPGAIREVASPSHALRVERLADAKNRVALATAGDVPDRDLVLDVRPDGELTGTFSGASPAGVRHFAAIVPSTRFGRRADGPRRIVFVIDRSGSMAGEPIAQARKAVAACLATLSPTDSFGIVAFDDRAEVFRNQLAAGDRDCREQAAKFLDKVDSRGGTELAQGFLKAAELLNREAGDVIVLTDGQVSGTEDILKQARAAGIRIHTLGIGSASQDRFLTLLARETGGVSRFMTPRERVDMAAVELFSSVGRPVASGIRVSGARVNPEPAPHVFAGTPLVFYGEQEGDGKLMMAWDQSNKPMELESIQACDTHSDTIWLLHGARLITDLDARLDGAFDSSKVGKREHERLERSLEKLSETFGLASRRMSLVAVIERAGDRAGELPKTQVVPVGLAQDIEAGAYFGRGNSVMSCLALTSMDVTRSAKSMGGYGYAAPAIRRKRSLFGSLFGRSAEQAPMLEEPRGKATLEDMLVDLACRLEPDGGIAGKNDEQRLLGTIVVLAAFLAAGHTPTTGAFRVHVAKLVEYLKSQTGTAHSQEIGKVVAAAEAGHPLDGDWQSFAKQLHSHLKLEAAKIWQTLSEKVGSA